MAGQRLLTAEGESSPSPGVWKRDHRVPLAAAGVFDAPSDYRFPLTKFTFTMVKASGSPGRVAARSPKHDYCITGDVKVGGVPNTPSQTFIPQIDCTHPSGPLGWSVGWGDEYDQTDNGQPIDLTGVPDGTYFLRGFVDPEHVLTESNRNNDVVNTELRIKGSAVTVLKQTHPVIRPPTAVLTSPANGARVTSAVTLRAKASAAGRAAVNSVQFLLDGEPLGKPVRTAPYRFRWKVGGTAPGSHWLSARVTDSHGMMGTARVVKVSVVSGAAPLSAGSLIARPGQPSSGAVLAPAGAPPRAALMNPSAGQIVSGTVPAAADITGGSPVRTVRFFLDGHPLGGPVSRPPYAIRWRTAGAANGPHTLSVRALAGNGQASTARIRVTAANPAPAMTCFVMQARATAWGLGTVTTRPISTVAAGETLLAFVSSAGTGAVAAASGTGGRPAVTLRTRRDTSLVFAVGTAGGAAGQVSLPAGWVMLRQAWPAGRSFWSQYTNVPVPEAGQAVRVAGPAGDSGSWDLAVVELAGDGS